MTLWMIPVRAPTATLHIPADRWVVFEHLTGFLRDDTRGASARVLETLADGTYVVEFRFEGPTLTGRRRAYRSVERVSLDAPGRLDFEGIRGPLPHLRDRISLRDDKGCTLVQYDSTFALKGSVLGWLVARLIVRRLMKRFMEAHLRQMGEALTAVRPASAACTHEFGAPG